MGLIAFNVQAEMVGFLADYPDLPIIAILHDDQASFLAPFAKCNVWAYRGMSPYSMAYKALPQGARFIFDNERDNDYDPDAWVKYLDQMALDRPDIVRISPASDTSNWPADGEWPENPTIKSKCYFYGLHMPNFATADQLRARVGSWGNPWCVTEVEADPMDPDNNNPEVLGPRLLDGAKTALAAGAQCAAIWGKDMQFSDGVRIASLRAAVDAFNKNQTGGTPVADTLEVRVAALEQRDALMTEACKRIIEGDWQGAAGAAADVVALQGGKDDVSGHVLPDPKA